MRCRKRYAIVNYPLRDIIRKDTSSPRSKIPERIVSNIRKEQHSKDKYGKLCRGRKILGKRIMRGSM